MTFAILFLTGCGVADFDVSRDVPESRITGNPLPTVLEGVLDAPLAIDIQGDIEAHDAGPIESITLTRLVLDITKTDEPPGDADDWSFLASARIHVESTAPSSNLPRVEVAHVVEPGDVTRLDFEPDSNVNLRPYVEEGAQMTAETEGEAPPDDTTYDGVVVFTVHPL